MQASSDRTFAASYDLPTKIISTLVCAMPLGMAIFIHSWMLGAGALISILLAYAFSPRAYQVSGQTLRIQRLVGDAVVTLHAVGEVRRTTRDDFRGCFKLFGSGGLFGYYGLYRTAALGKANWYLTSRARAVVLHTGGRTVLVSPDDTDGFLAAVQVGFDEGIATAAASLAERRNVPGALPDEESSRLMGALAGGLIGFAVLALVAAALLYAPGPPSYTLTSRSLTIHDRFYPVTLQARAVDVDHVRIVDVSWDRNWQTVSRTSGFANAYYRAGWFRVGNGTKVRLYRAAGTQLVLLPPNGDGPTVLMEATDPNQLVRRIRAAWAQ
jgi:hypothetical protein